MNEFMVLVERAVRPVVAGPKRKMRMREELLAHLEGIHEEELAHLGDAAAARAETVRRFGDPAALTPDLQQSVSFRDRIDGRLNRMCGWRPGESAMHFSARLAILVALLILMWLVITLAGTAVSRPEDASVPTAAMLLRLFGALLVIAPIGTFLMTLLYIRIRDSLHGAFGAPRSWRRVLALASLSFFVVPVLGTLFYLVGVPDAGEFANELTTARALVAAGVGYSFIPLYLIVHARMAGPNEIRHVEWASLDIGQ